MTVKPQIFRLTDAVFAVDIAAVRDQITVLSRRAHERMSCSAEGEKVYEQLHVAFRAVDAALVGVLTVEKP